MYSFKKGVDFRFRPMCINKISFNALSMQTYDVQKGTLGRASAPSHDDIVATDFIFICLCMILNNQFYLHVQYI